MDGFRSGHRMEARLRSMQVMILEPSILMGQTSKSLWRIPQKEGNGSTFKIKVCCHGQLTANI
jgi:hypothetical protein